MERYAGGGGEALGEAYTQVYDEQTGALIGVASRDLTPLHPAPGLWETDPEDIWRATSGAMRTPSVVGGENRFCCGTKGSDRNRSLPLLRVRKVTRCRHAISRGSKIQPA